MQAQFKRRVALQRLTTERDPIGQPVERWVDVGTVWGDVAHKSGLTTIKGDQETSVVKASIRIRYRASVTAGMRAVVAGATYQIDAVLPDLVGKMYIDLVCRRIG